MRQDWKIETGDSIDVLRKMEDASVNSCITSPPYWGLRDYGVEGQLGLEPTFQEYIRKMVSVFREVKRILRDDGTMWLNLGDSYATGGLGGGGSFVSERGAWRGRSSVKGWRPAPKGRRHKDIMGIPWMVAFALQEDGWILRQDIVWNKTNPMPESVRDRCTKSHEYIFLLTKRSSYFCDMESIREPAKDIGRVNGREGRLEKEGARPPGTNARKLKRLDYSQKGKNKRSVWTVAVSSYKGAHFATFPPKLIEPCVLAGCPKKGVVLDPFAGSGTTGVVALKHGRKFVGIEINPEYVKMCEERIIASLRQTVLNLECDG